MEIIIKINEKLLKETIELKLNQGKKIQTETFEELFNQMEWKHLDILEKVSTELELQIVVNIVNSFSFLKHSLKRKEMIYKHNKRLKLKDCEFKSGYWIDSQSNCCPKCKRSGSDFYVDHDGIEHSESYLKEKYKKDFGGNYKDIIEYRGQCYRCGIGFTEVWMDHDYIHEIQ